MPEGHQSQIYDALPSHAENNTSGPPRCPSPPLKRWLLLRLFLTESVGGWFVYLMEYNYLMINSTESLKFLFPTK